MVGVRGGSSPTFSLLLSSDGPEIILDIRRGRHRQCSCKKILSGLIFSLIFGDIGESLSIRLHSGSTVQFYKSSTGPLPSNKILKPGEQPHLGHNIGEACCRSGYHLQ